MDTDNELAVINNFPFYDFLLAWLWSQFDKISLQTVNSATLMQLLHPKFLLKKKQNRMLRIEYFFFQVALELASHMDLQKVAMEERLPIYKAEQVVIVNKYDHANPNLRDCKAKYINFSLIG